MKDDNDGTKKQLLLTVARINQSTSVVRAIMLSNNSNSVLFGHLYGTQYISIVTDINKLFDKSSINISRLLDLFKNKITDIEYKEAKKNIKNIEEKYDSLLKQIKLLRHNIGAHLNKNILNKMYKDPYSSEYEIDLNRVQLLLKEIIDLLSSLSFIDRDEQSLLSSRIGPKDVMDILGLKIKPGVMENFLKNAVTQDKL